ncbi:MAG: VWA domain-containing protein [Polyangiaceae bacterium]
MSFLVLSALAIAGLVIAPLLAHLLRRGRAEEREFPAAKLVPTSPPVARQRTRLEDRALFAIRAAMILLLALLGATPFVRCSRLALDRSSGASVALAIVVDDSGSMRGKLPGGERRIEKALAGAEELLDSTREGDAVAIVAAGAPARLVLAATTDLSLARETLSKLHATDRDTDLSGATQLARSALERLPHTDKRVVLLSDLAGDAIPDGKIPVVAPLEALKKPIKDCGLVDAIARGNTVSAQVVCSDASATNGRRLALRPVTPALGPSSGEPASPGSPKPAPLASQAGSQELTLELPSDVAGWEVALDGTDDLPENDACPISPKAAAMGVGVLSDATRSSTVTGGPTLVEHALSALDADVSVQPLALAPDDPKELDGLRALVLDDPAGLSPESRSAIKKWLERGRVAVLFAGPAAARAQLASKLDPFLDAVRWEPADIAGLDETSLAWLISDGSGLDQLAPKGRAILEGALPGDAEVLARWTDGRPFMARRNVGRGQAYVVGLPISAEQSDFALRPAFLALLDHLLQQAERLGGPARTTAGVAWLFPASGELKVSGPGGQLEAELVTAEESQPATRRVTPGRLGRYRVDQSGEATYRIVSLSADELRRQAEASTQTSLASPENTQASRIDVSPHIAFGLLALLTLELLVRVWRRAREGSDAEPPASRRAGDAAKA